MGRRMRQSIVRIVDIGSSMRTQRLDEARKHVAMDMQLFHRYCSSRSAFTLRSQRNRFKKFLYRDFHRKFGDQSRNHGEHQPPTVHSGCCCERRGEQLQVFD